MLSKKYISRTAALLIIFCQLSIISDAQEGIDLNVPKPKEYDNRVLRSERSSQKKFTLPKRFVQNTVTHYNYYFNANNKIKEVIDRAKAAFKDDYSTLLPFYNYSLDVTAADTIQLDSVTYKSQTGIALHDLRNDWIDNLYLIWGSSYYLQKKFDSAFLMFQFINYAFAPKEKDGYYVNIGSRMDGNNAFSIATKEKNSLPRRIFSEPPSRNDAFIWQIRNFLAQDLYTEAASLIVTLKTDPQFPKRLNNDLEEMQALWFYKQGIWDSAAAHLSLALGNAGSKQEQARWEYLLAQLYELSGDFKESEAYFAKAIKHTTDPILDIYARLYSIRVNKDGGENYIDKNIATLVKMAKRDKYTDYRDIIYYMAAQMELERNNIDAAMALLRKSTQYTSNDASQRNKAFLQLAELSFDKGYYRQSYSFYDSLQMGDPVFKDPDAIIARKKVAGNFADNLEIIYRQDSLQRIAAMPEDERKEFIRKLVRQLRKQQGLKEEVTTGGGSTLPAIKDPAPLFPTTTKGEWAFYNASARQKGVADFSSKWGNRPNQDNWRRSAALAGILRNNKDPNDPATQSSSTGASEGADELSYDGLLAKLPLTAEQIKKSNDSIQDAQLSLGKLYIQETENCTLGTETLENLRQRFPEYQKMDEVLFNLYYCYNKHGQASKAAEMKKLMAEKYTNSNFTTIVTTGKDPQSNSANSDATRTYEGIYDMFIEGRFEEAIAAKKSADSIYSKNFWTPQLLYIEAVYYVKQRQDSTAKTVLNNIINTFGTTPLATKAATMIDVLNRRAQIEDELRNLVITRPPDDTTTRYRQAPIVTNNLPPTQRPAVVDTATKRDSVITQPTVQQPPVQQPPVVTNDTKTLDSLAARPAHRPSNNDFAFTPETPHYVLIVLHKVDRIFVNEARNAFARHNRDVFYNKQMNAELVEIDDENRLLLVSPFKNAQEAIAYIDQTKPITGSQIVPWLKGGRYTFSIITEANLDVLRNSKDINKYKQFLEKNLPGKFEQ